jgi:hypothetical protein
VISKTRALLRTEYAALGISNTINNAADINFRVRPASVSNTDLMSSYHEATPNNKALITIYNANHDNVGDIKRSIQRELLGNHLFHVYTEEERQNLILSIVSSQSDPSVAPGWQWAQVHCPNESLATQSRTIFSLIAETVDLLEPVDHLTTRPTQTPGVFTLSELQKEIRLTAEELKEHSRFDNTFSPIQGRELDGLSGIDEISFNDANEPEQKESVIRFRF